MSHWFNELIVKLLPLAPKGLVKPFARRYVAGETMDEMMGVVRRYNEEGILCTVDLLGEFITRKEEANETADTYKAILAELYKNNLNANVSVKLTALGLLLDKELCYELIKELVSIAKTYNNFVRIDMEDTECTTPTIDIYLRLRKEFDNVGIVLQAYLRRTLGDVRHIIAERAGHFRLCKGIYVEPRFLTYKDHKLINKNYTLVLEEMFKNRAYVGIATHNEELVWEAMRLIDQYQLQPNEYEFQMLLGVDPELEQIIVNAGHRLRIYVPYGKDWYAYSTRRLKENPSIAGHVMKNMFKQSQPSAPQERRQLQPSH